MISEFSKILKPYLQKTDSDYWVIFNGHRVPTFSLILTEEDEKFFIQPEGNKPYYKKELIDRLSPDNINSCEFWEFVTEHFPLFSIAGGIQNISTIEQAKQLTHDMAVGFGVIKSVVDHLVQIDESKILEIGPGYGGFMDFIEENFENTTYYGIDVNPLFIHPRIYKTDGTTITNKIPNNLDVVYSMNVFQHLSKKQRSEYYRKSFKKLKKGGIFIFGMFVETILNKDWEVWGTKDENGRNYCNFFKQFTIVDREEELFEELNNIGYDVEKISPLENKSHYLTFKCTKK